MVPLTDPPLLDERMEKFARVDGSGSSIIYLNGRFAYYFDSEETYFCRLKIVSLNSSLSNDLSDSRSDHVEGKTIGSGISSNDPNSTKVRETHTAHSTHQGQISSPLQYFSSNTFLLFCAIFSLPGPAVRFEPPIVGL
jgi:hypothetical protein